MSMLDKLLNTDPEVSRMKKEERDARLQERRDRIKQKNEETKKRRQEMQKERAEKQSNRKSIIKAAPVEEECLKVNVSDINEDLVEEESDIEEVKYIRPRTRR